ncbi:hypothetical protein GCM10028802_13910 [Terrabacter terrigena]
MTASPSTVLEPELDPEDEPDAVPDVADEEPLLSDVLVVVLTCRLSATTTAVDDRDVL